MARWRKQPNERGLVRVCQGPRGFQLREGGETLIHVAPVTGFGRDKYTIRGWYWYGIGQNTADKPVDTPEKAKEEAMAFYREHRKQHPRDVRKDG